MSKKLRSRTESPAEAQAELGEAEARRPAMYPARRRERRPLSLRRQRDVLCDVMLAAGTCETWLTLAELSRITRYGEASISAQLRHLRKPEYGAFAVEKRQRDVAGSFWNIDHGPLWEYRLSRSPRPEGSVDGVTRI